MNKRIALNAIAVDQFKSGANSRFLGIFPALASLLFNSEFFIYKNSDCPVFESFNTLENVEYINIPLRKSDRIKRSMLCFSYWDSNLKKLKPHIFENFCMPAVKFREGLNLLTIHDIRRAYLPKFHPERIAYEFAINKSLRHTDQVIAVSQSMAEELESRFQPKNITVIYNAVDVKRLSDLRTKLNCNPPRGFKPFSEFLLSVGHLEPRKNYGRLLVALNILKCRGYDVPLIIVGHDNGLKQRLFEQAHALKLCDNIRWYSDIPEHDLAYLYASCSALILPSIYEGFGIPLIEAMAMKVPVAMSNLPVFKEVFGAGGEYFDPYDPESIASAVLSILADNAHRERVVCRGSARVWRFDIARSAADYAELYNAYL